MRPTGLLKKAQSLRESSPHLRILRPDELGVDQDQEITPQEREKVMAQIEEAIARNRVAITPEAMSFRPRKKDSALPVVVNLLAAAVIVVGIGLAWILSQRAEKAVTAAPAVLLSAEGKVLEALREQSRLQLEGKDREVAAIRDKLAGADKERERIRQEAGASIRQREQELGEALARSLQEERRRLAAGGVSEEAIARKMVSFEARNRAAMEETLAAFSEQSRAEMAEKEKTIERIQAEYRQGLAQAQSERSRLQEESARRQSELEAGFRQRQMALEQDKAAALAELDTLRRQAASEQLVSDQLLAYYGRAQAAIQGARPDAARAALSDLRRYLDEPALASLPAIARRRPVDVFLADSLDDLIRRQSDQESGARDMQGLVASANLIAAVASLVQEGDELFQEQGYAKAREVYLSALARIPAVQAGYGRLAEIEAIFAEGDTRAVAASLAEGNTAYRAGDNEAAVERYGSALRMLQVERGAVDALVSQLMDIGALRKALQTPAAIGPDPAADARARSAAWLSALRARLAAPSAAPEQVAAAGTMLVALLETKLLVQKILLSPDVSARYPDLFGRLELYLEALAEESRTDARMEILRDLDELLREAGGTAAADRAEAHAARYPAADQRALFVTILDRLQGLLK